MGTASHVWPINSHKYSERYRNKNVREPYTTLRQVFLRKQKQLHLDRIVRTAQYTQYTHWELFELTTNQNVQEPMEWLLFFTHDLQGCQGCHLNAYYFG